MRKKNEKWQWLHGVCHRLRILEWKRLSLANWTIGQLLTMNGLFFFLMWMRRQCVDFVWLTTDVCARVWFKTQFQENIEFRLFCHSHRYVSLNRIVVPQIGICFFFTNVIDCLCCYGLFHLKKKISVTFAMYKI